MVAMNDLLDLQTEREHRSQVIEFNDRAAPYPAESTVVQLIEAQVERTPHDEAIRLGDQALSYRALNEHANRLAAHLRTLGIGPGRLVALYLEHSIEVVCAILGVLKAGAAYVPLDPAVPQERLAYLLEDLRRGMDASSTLVLTQPHLAPALPAGAARVELDAHLGALAGYPAANPAVCASPADLAYLIYTSGSTGKPKGVMIEHRSLVNYLWWANARYCAGERLAWPLFSSLAFDLTVSSIFTPLIKLTGWKNIPRNTW